MIEVKTKEGELALFAAGDATTILAETTHIIISLSQKIDDATGGKLDKRTAIQSIIRALYRELDGGFERGKK